MKPIIIKDETALLIAGTKGNLDGVAVPSAPRVLMCVIDDVDSTPTRVQKHRVGWAAAAVAVAVIK
jgi:hypothetical protein